MASNVRVMTVSGQEVEIPYSELERLLHTQHPVHHQHETNEHYQERAYNNICEAAKFHGLKHVKNTEDDMKDLMVFALRHEDPEMLGELIEWFIAQYTKKVGA